MKKTILIFSVLLSIFILSFWYSCSPFQSAGKSDSAQSFDILDESNLIRGSAVIDANTIQQNIRGFGGANIIGWQNDLTSAQRTTAFSASSGIGLSILRVRVSPNSADWASNKDTINAAKSNGAMVIASAWSAPASMKSNNNTTGGKLNSGSYSAFAAHLKSFCSTVGGVTAISAWNEPNWTCDYESMNNTASEIGNFYKSYGSSCGASTMGPETLNMDSSWNSTVNSTAGSGLTYICGHIYGSTPYAVNLSKEVWMTEHYTNSSVNGNDWTNAMNAAKEIHDCMNAGWNAYVWWYIRRSYGPIDESGNITKLGYVMAHYARYVRPGYNKISCTTNPTSGIYATAYKSGSNLVIVAINQNSTDTYQDFSINGLSVSGLDRWKTTSGSNLASDSITVSGGSFGITLPAKSITTLKSR